MATDWLSKTRHHLHLDCHLPAWPEGALKGFDAEQWAGNFDRAGFDLVALFAKCHFGNAFYFTRFENQHPALETDMLSEALDACHRRGIRGIAYYSLCTDYKASVEHPEWAARQPDGAPIGDMGLFGSKLCLNTAYSTELVLPQLEELLRAYDIDGFFLDIPLNNNARGGCYCDACRAKFQEVYGRPMGEDATPGELRDHCERATLDLVREVRKLIDAIRPGSVLVTNRAWRLGTLRGWSELCDVGVMESQPQHGGYNSHSLRRRHARTLPVPVQVMTVRFYSGWGDMTLKPTEQQKYEYSLMVAHGGIVSTGDQVEVEGTLQDAAYDRFAEALDYVSEREKILEGAATVKHGAILMYNHEDQLTPPLLAAERSLGECHAQFDILEEWDVDQLPDYRWAVLPDLPRLEAATCEKLADWVKAGGRLLATGAAGGLGENFALAEVLGIDYKQAAPFSIGHLTPEASQFPTLPEIPLLLKSRLLEVQPTTAEPLMQWRYPIAEQKPPETTFRSPFPPAGELSESPAVTRNRFGDGLAVYCAAELFAEYQRHNHHWTRQVIEALWRLIDPEPPYEIEGPAQLQANLMQRERTLLLNLVNFTCNTPGSGGHQPIEKVQPLADVVVTVRRPASSVMVQPGRTMLDFKTTDGATRIVVPKLGLYDILQIIT